MNAFGYRFAVALATVVMVAACGVESTAVPFDEPSSTSAELRKTPRVDSVSPLTATLGVEATFTVAGANLSSLTFELTDCAGLRELSGGTSSSRRFACTPSGTPGQKSGGLRNPRNGAVVYSFVATVTTGCTQPTVTGAFAPSGNSILNLDSLLQARNPIVRIEATGGSLVFTARNGEKGTLNLTGSTVSGVAQASSDAGFNAFRVLNATQVGVSSQGDYQPLTFTGVTPTAPFDGFMFLDPMFGAFSWATQVNGEGNTIRVTDVFGATGVITLNCAP